ncbi:MAG: ATP phosphoribosyltransferase regulatory subunit [Pseudomonadota bacterium]
MTPETAQQFRALEHQAHDLMNFFCEVGYEAVAPSVIQPADIFLDVVGEDLRRRTYVFSDTDGAELCLRPDLTVPTCRLHWQRCTQNGSSTLARYCYNGPAFRFQPADASTAHPREFRQLGIELFGDKNKERADIEVLHLIVEALRRAGLRQFRIRIGDLGIFQDLLSVLDLPARWRDRLRASLWRPDTFRDELRRLATQPDASIEGLPEALVVALRGCDAKAAERVVTRYFDENDIELIGTRTLREIVDALMSAIADAEADALPAETVRLIELYFDVKAPARAAGARLADLMQENGVDIAPALALYQKRLKLLTELDIDVATVEFSAEFGRTIQYYTGFVFEVLAEPLGERSPVAGGGRYDNLMRMVGAKVEVPAVGAMIHTERLLSVVGDGGRRD